MAKRPTVNFKVEAWIKIEDLVEHPKNPRIDLRQDKARFESLKESILEGVFEPIKVSRKTGYCLAGNQRIKAFSDLGFEEVPAMYNDCETEKEELIVLIKDNNEWGAPDWDATADLLKANLLALETLGFNEADMRFLKKRMDQTERDAFEDEVPEAPAKPRAKLGDIYQLGEHRLMCGDSTSLEDVKKLMNGQKADMVFTDPPYNVDMTGKNEMLKKFGKARRDESTFGMQNDNMGREEFRTFLIKVFEAYREVAKSSAPFYVCHSSSSQRDFEDAMELAGLRIRNQIIWNKTIASMGWGDYRWKHEPIFYASFGGESTSFYGDRSQYTVLDESWDADKIRRNILKLGEKFDKGGSTVWKMSRDQNYVHPTQKPIELVEQAIRNSSKEEDIVLDLFGGSGSTLIGAHKTGRIAYLMELDPKYVDVIIDRWEKYSEQKAVKI